MPGTERSVMCGRCRRPVRLREAESCWFCSSPLCGGCWEEQGHCGHEGAGEDDRRIRAMLRKVVTDRQ
jgi:hypothetical protein